MAKYQSTKLIELGSCAFRQPKATSHCKFIHGYQLTAKVWLEANELDEKNWVFDFGAFKELSKSLQDTFDHKLVIDKNDPAKPAFRELERYGAAEIIEMDGVGIEKFAQYVFEETDNYVKYHSNKRVWCGKVEVFEHEKNSAIFKKIESSVKEVSLSSKTVEAKHVELKPVSNIPPSGPIPAAVGNTVTEGWSNPFGGTSWGA
jgi:6-pyruvoyltetrahydropterin/6-carboxytetrahydropterin synthase